MNLRSVAAEVLMEVVQHGKSLSAVLPPALEDIEKPSDRALLQEICYGVLRWQLRLQALARQLMRKPLKEKERRVECLIWVGLYQLVYMRLPAYAAVTETVNAAKVLRKPWASSLINGVLRNYLRNPGELQRQADRQPEAELSHPDWLLQALRADWSGQWRAIAQANNERAPMTLRVNLDHQSRSDYIRRLAQAGISAVETAHLESGVILEQALNVERLPGFDAGDVSVQDAAAQLAAILLDVQPGMRVLDACAAPGGKSGHVLESQPRLEELVALDIDASRLERVAENLRRLGVQATLQLGDAADPGQWWDGRKFERILLDAPCSATGVIRRHPDIKLLRRAEDIDELARRQAEILEALWPLLATGGILLYVTCSIMKRENSQQVEDFLRRHADAQELPLPVVWGVRDGPGRQILPGQDSMDGFYYAVMQKR